MKNISPWDLTHIAGGMHYSHMAPEAGWKEDVGSAVLQAIVNFVVTGLLTIITSIWQKKDTDKKEEDEARYGRSYSRF